MRRPRGGGLPAGAGKVRAGIERWRRTRQKRSPMPEELWAAAVGLARRHGVYAISRALGVSFETLRARLARGASDGQWQEPGRASRRAPGAESRTRGTLKRPASGAATMGFVELRAVPTPVAPSAAADVVVDVTDETGARLTIRVAGVAVDVAAVVGAFRGERG